MERCETSHNHKRRADMRNTRKVKRLNLLQEIEKAVLKEQNKSHLSVDFSDQLDVEEQTSLVEHQQQQEEDSR